MLDSIDVAPTLMFAGVCFALSAFWFILWRWYRRKRGRTDLPPEGAYNPTVNASNIICAVGFLIGGVVTLILAIVDYLRG